MKDYTIIDIPEELYNELKKLAKEQNITVDELASKVLRAKIKEEERFLKDVHDSTKCL